MSIASAQQMTCAACVTHLDLSVSSDAVTKTCIAVPNEASHHTNMQIVSNLHMQAPDNSVQPVADL